MQRKNNRLSQLLLFLLLYYLNHYHFNKLLWTLKDNSLF